MSATKGDIRIEFENVEATDKALAIVLDFQNKVQADYMERHPEYVGDTISTNLMIEDHSESEIKCTVFSGKPKNFDWQIDYFIYFMKKIGNIRGLTVDVWVEGDGLNFDENSPIDDYTPTLD